MRFKLELCALCVLALPVSGAAGLGPAAAARDWCKSNTLHYLEKRGYKPYNWSATTYLEDNKYVTRGEWRVGVEHIKVECGMNRGAKKPSGNYKILNIQVLNQLPARRRLKSK